VRRVVLKILNSSSVLRTVFFATVLFRFHAAEAAGYMGSVSATGPTAIQSAGLDILGIGGGSGDFLYKGGGNAVDAVVAAGLTACVVNSGNCSLGGYGGHMLIWKSGLDGSPQVLTCIDFNGAAGSLATSNMFAPYLDPVTGTWTNGTPQNQYGWKAAGVPGTLAGLYMAQTNYGRKVSGTNYFSFAEILKPALARMGQAAVNGYYSGSSLSNLVMELYTNSPGYLDTNGQPNPNSANNPCTVFYAGDIAADIVAAMQANGGLVTYADLTNYRPREVAPYLRHFSAPNGTPAWVAVAPPGASGVSVLQQIAIMEALGWTNGPAGTWDSLHYWHARAEASRMMWKEHFQWIGDPWAGIRPPDFLGNGSTNFADQLLAHVTNGYAFSPAWDTNEIQLTNSIAGSVISAVNGETNVPILVHWNDIRYGTCNISTSDQWGNCVVMTFSMGGGYGAQVGVTNRAIVFGQAMALFDPRPGWPNSIGPGKRQVDNMSPAIVLPDLPGSSTNGVSGGRAPLAIGAVGGSTIENNMAMHLIKYLTDAPSAPVIDPPNLLYNYEGNTTIYMNSYPSGVQAYLPTVGLSAPGGSPTSGQVTYVQAWVAPTIQTQPSSTNVTSGSTADFSVTAAGLPLFYRWLSNGVPLTDGGQISGSQTAHLTVASATSGAAYSVVLTNGSMSITSSAAALTINGAPVITLQPSSRTNVVGSTVTFSVAATGAAPLAYRWTKNGTNLFDGGNISGATTTQLTVDFASLADSGAYSVLATNSVGSVTSVVATLAIMKPQPFLASSWNVSSGDGQPWMNLSASTSIPNQRTIAYNALSNHLYVVSRSSSTTSNYVVYVLNATNGALLYTLKTNGIQSNVGKGGIGLVGIGVADDGAIYACNTAPDAAGSAGTDPTSMFRVYRWANANPNTTPSQIFLGDPTGSSAAMRWGDVLSVRGAGTNTQILVDMTYFGTTAGTTGYVAVLSPSNAFLTNFVSRWFTTTNIATTVGRSLEFDGTNNAIWQKTPDASLYKTTFNPAASLGGNRISSTNVFAAAFPTGLMAIGLDLPDNLAAGSFSNSPTTADSLNLYDISNLSSPVFLSSYDFATNPRTANGNRISQTFFKNGLVFSLDCNNGLIVSQLEFPPAIVKLTQMQKLANGAFQIGYSNLNGGGTYTVYASSNLFNWTPLGSPTQAAPGLFQFTDPEATDMARRFYQLRWP
jgi:gamma-glutamyltranspeptidase